MKLTLKEISVITLTSSLFSVIAVQLLGFTSAIAFPDWMRAIMTESVTPNSSTRALYLYGWDILVVNFLSVGIPFIVIFSGLLWWLGRASYAMFGVFLFVFLAFQYAFIPLWYGGFGFFQFSFYMLLQPIILLLCAYLVISFFKKHNESIQ